MWEWPCSPISYELPLWDLFMTPQVPQRRLLHLGLNFLSPRGIMTFFWAILFGDLSLHCLCQKCSHAFITGAGFVLDRKLHWTMWGSRFACTSMKQCFLFVAFSNERIISIFFISVTYSEHNFIWLVIIKSLIKTNVAGGQAHGNQMPKISKNNYFFWESKQPRNHPPMC